MKRPLAIVIGGLLLVTLAQGPAQAAPGDPFGGDDPGCVPDIKDHLKCSNGALSAICKAWRAVIKCHTKQADTVFKTGATADDETCEKSGGGKAALEKLNAALGKLATVCTGTTVIANANMVRDTLFGDNTAGSIDAMNGDIYCDPGIPIDSSGDDPGSVNNTATDAKGRQKCADSVDKDLRKLLGAVRKCYTNAAS